MPDLGCLAFACFFALKSFVKVCLDGVCARLHIWSNIRAGSSLPPKTHRQIAFHTWLHFEHMCKKTWVYLPLAKFSLHTEELTEARRSNSKANTQIEIKLKLGRSESKPQGLERLPGGGCLEESVVCRSSRAQTPQNKNVTHSRHVGLFFVIRAEV